MDKLVRFFFFFLCIKILDNTHYMKNLKVKVVLTVLAALFCVCSIAQNAEKTWRWTVEAESCSGDLFDFGVGATYGYQFNQRLYAGFGTDVILNKHADLRLPVFAVAKLDILKEQNTPVVDFRGGVSMYDEEFPYGFASLAFGYKMKGEKTVVCPMIGWSKTDDSNSMVLRFSIEF